MCGLGLCLDTFFSFLHVDIWLFQHHFLKRPHFIAVARLSNISWLHLCGPISGLSVLLHWSVCLLFHQQNIILIFVAYSMSWIQGASILQLCSPLMLLAIISLLAFPYKLQYHFVNIYRITGWNFYRNCIKSIYQDGKNWLLDIEFSCSWTRNISPVI